VIEARTITTLASRARTRETREGWALLTVETGTNGDSKSTYNRNGVLLWFVRWACHKHKKRSLSCLCCSSPPGTKYFFPHRTLHISVHLSLPPSKSCRVPCLLVCAVGYNDFNNVDMQTRISPCLRIR
jgi:hypothetical protein